MNAKTAKCEVTCSVSVLFSLPDCLRSRNSREVYKVVYLLSSGVDPVLGHCSSVHDALIETVCLLMPRIHYRNVSLYSFPVDGDIGVASYGAPGHFPLDFQLFTFSGDFRAAQTSTLDSLWTVVTYPY